jgi:molybdopterin converting factor small subunit
MAAAAGGGELKLEMQSGAMAGEVRGVLEKQVPKLPWPAGTMLAVNQDYASLEQVLKDGDEVAIIPPVSGGGGGGA